MEPSSFPGFHDMMTEPAKIDKVNNVYVPIAKTVEAASLPPSLKEGGVKTANAAPLKSTTANEMSMGHSGRSVSSSSAGVPRIKKKRRRRRLDIGESLQLYAERIVDGPLSAELHELEGAYLSTFQIFSTETESRKVHSNNAFILMDICRQKGVEVKGVTSECKIGGEYRASLLSGDTRENAKIVYVGNYNYFTKHPESKWSIKPCDKVYKGYL